MSFAIGTAVTILGGITVWGVFAAGNTIRNMLTR